MLEAEGDHAPERQHLIDGVNGPDRNSSLGHADLPTRTAWLWHTSENPRQRNGAASAAHSLTISTSMYLDFGVDDYVVKPFSPREVVARVRALLRRVGVQEEIAVGDLRIDLRGHSASLSGERLELSKLEFDLLSALAQHPGMAWPRERLLERVWGSDFPGTERVVDVHITGLRKKLGDTSDTPRFIETVRGVGYRFREE
ncbi:winged helix-turn-helix domain-containing protein [Deinococcus geothermalis]|uniref:winged helix-turn-helix domain-containing protein n=1 Tax=Deinococcus geothermalis TaxID=68909 RepID=UPI0038B8A3F8